MTDRHPSLRSTALVIGLVAMAVGLGILFDDVAAPLRRLAAMTHETIATTGAGIVGALLVVGIALAVHRVVATGRGPQAATGEPRDAARRLGDAVEAMPVAFLVSDRRDGSIRYANPAARALLALPGDGAIALADTVPLRAAIDRLAAAASTDRVCHLETRLHRPRGDEFPATLSARAFDHDGAPCLVTGVLDASERQAAEVALLRQRDAAHERDRLEALGPLLAEVAHQINNPLSIVVAQAALLQEQAADPAIAARGKKIQSAADRCARIVRTILAMGRQGPPKPGVTDLNRIATAEAERQGGSLRTAGIDLQLDLAGDLPAIWADENQVGRVVAHLIDVAGQAMTDAARPRRLSIATALDASNGMARLAIAGSGPGAGAPAASPAVGLWDAATAGSSIGLSLCRAIVIAHGGAMAADAGPDGGARFLLRLPIAAAPPARSP